MLKHMDGISNKELLDEVQNSKIAIVDFFATWCGPCRMLGPELEELAKRDDIDVIKIDVDKSQEISFENDVEVVPTMLFFKEGKLVGRRTGYYSKEDLEEIINEGL